MEFLKKEIAPITEMAWKEIEEGVKSVTKNYLTARKVVDIEGPNGMGFSAVSTGRLAMTRNQRKNSVNYGVREVIPLIETRKPFELDIWELDNVERGAKDINLHTMQEAAKQIAVFEENVIFKGLDSAGVKGMDKSSLYPVILIPDKADNFLKLVAEQINKMQSNNVEGPYSIVMTQKLWLDLINVTNTYPILPRIKDLLGGQVIVNDHIDKTYLLSERGGDYELTLGQDLSVGYDSHDSRKMKLFLTESFTFRVLSPEAVMIFSG